MRQGLVEGRTLRRLRGLLAIFAFVCGAMLAIAPSALANVLLVGTFNGKPGGYTTIRQAVAASHPGDWILIGPGDYKESGVTNPVGGRGSGGAVLIEKAGLHIRGMNRNGVVLDGTKTGSPQCSSNAADQELGPLDTGGNHVGRNGIEVFKTVGVSVENLTACNFLTGSEGGGNQVWFNFGDGSGKQMTGAWRGAFLSATSTYYETNKPFGSYGIFVSNTAGPGIYTQVYANNMADSDFYIGACPDCNTILDHAHAEDGALGYSGTNSGGHLTIQNSEFNNNKSGFVSNSQNNDDQPSPQDGKCPNGEIGPTGTHNCWLFTKNAVHDNNNPNVPTTGVAGAGPVGSGVVLSGDRNNIVAGNTIYNNGAWGVLLVPYPAVEEEPPPDLSEFNCGGGIKAQINGKTVCYYDDWGNEIANNKLSNNGYFCNPTGPEHCTGAVRDASQNVDLAEIANADAPPATGNCWHGNEDTAGVTSEPKAIQTTRGTCGGPDIGGEPALVGQVACDSQFFESLASCPTGPGVNYPRLTRVEMKPLPPQKTMANPCRGVPRNPWCPDNAITPPPYSVPGPPDNGGSSGESCHEGDGNGQVEDSKSGTASFSFDADPCDDGAAESVSEEDSGSGTEFHSTQTQSVTYDDAAHSVTVKGIGTDNGLPVTFVMTAIDSELVPGGLYSLVLSDGYSRSGPLTSGNVKLH